MKFTSQDKRDITKWAIIITIALVVWVGLKNINHIAFAMKILTSHILFPLLLGAALAFIINIPMSALEKRKVVRKVIKNPTALRAFSLVTTYISVIFIFFVLLFTITPQLLTSLQKIADQALVLIDQLKHSEFLNKYIDVSSFLDVSAIKTKLLSTFESEQIIGTIFFGISEVFESIFAGFIAFVFSIYILSAKETLSQDFSVFIAVVFSQKTSDKISEIGRVVKKHFYNFFTGQFLVCTVLGILCFVEMTIFSFPYAYVVSLIIWVLSLIPMIGPITGILLGASIVFIDSPNKALIFLIMIIITKQLNDYITYPRIVGKAVGLKPIWILVAITLGGALLGVIGMIIFVPLFAILYDLLILNNPKFIERKKALTSSLDVPVEKPQIHTSSENKDSKI